MKDGSSHGIGGGTAWPYMSPYMAQSVDAIRSTGQVRCQAATRSCIIIQYVAASRDIHQFEGFWLVISAIYSIPSTEQLVSTSVNNPNPRNAVPMRGGNE